ncbi:MAG: helicase C-terminal domain-containing protein [Planctomycetota bacterium]|nr:helicase C-terminal domain-containing protein [Planctomycetota bacterium]
MSDAPEPASLDELLGPEGAVAGALAARGGYEVRPQQMAMARLVDEGLSSRRHVLIEAGTGVGKSFAYLVPLLRWAAATGRKAAIATSTIALQEQLVRKDLPLLTEALPFPVSFALVKGRGNYLCTRRLHRALAESVSLFEVDEAHRQLEEILAWSTVTSDGSRQDLPFLPRGDVWESVRAEQGNCLGRRCTFYERCHYQHSRRRAHAATLLVLNHHVLLADLAMRRSGASFLPEVDVIVVDEAHDFENVAADHLGTKLSSFGVDLMLGRLWNQRRRRGLLAGWAPARMRQAVRDVRTSARRHFTDLRTSFASEREGTIRLDDQLRLPEALGEGLRRLAADLTDVVATADPELAMEVRARAASLAAAAEAVTAVAEPTSSEWVRWLEVSARGRVSVQRSPVDVGPLLGEVLWEPYSSVVLTSATLSTGRPPSFAFLQRRLGLEDALAQSVGSPFLYAEQARIHIRADLPDPARDGRAHEQALPEHVLAAVDRAAGGVLVLFTAYGSMLRTAELLRPELEARGLPLRVQGEGMDRQALLEAFREEGGVLFGVASFWQGVDLPGNAVSEVVITRLPFEVPTHPLQAARARRTEERGGHAFRDLALPQAALRLKQGFGRLIRRSTDEGVVTILDPRIVTKHYGRVLLDSLPECPVQVDGA